MKINLKKACESFNIFIRPDEELLVSFNVSSQFPVYIYVYNPVGEYIGEVHFERSGCPKKLYFSKDLVLANSKQHHLLTGIYSIDFFSFSPLFKGAYIEFDVVTEKYGEYLSASDKIFLCNVTKKDVLNSIKQVLISSNKKYLRGDFHSHTNYSDGELLFNNIGEVLEDRKMDFVAITEHNSIAFHHNSKGMPIVQALELTLPTGHLNIHGLQKREVITKDFMNTVLDSFNPNLVMKNGSLATGSFLDGDKVDINRILTRYKDCNISINHMFLEPWHFTMNTLDLALVNTIEVICDPTYEGSDRANAKAVAFLDFLWNKGHRIYGIGGSDSHFGLNGYYKNQSLPSVYADPSTYVYNTNPGAMTMGDIVDEVKSGHTYVSRFLKLDICINPDALKPGDSFDPLRNLDYNVTCTLQAFYKGRERKAVLEALDGARVFFVFDGKKVIEEPFVFDKTYSLKDYSKLKAFAGAKKRNEPHWIRFGIEDVNGYVISYVNPIWEAGKLVYDELKKGKLNTNFKDNLKEFNNIYD